MAQEHRGVTVATVVGSIPTRGNELLFLNLVSFLRSGTKAGVEFRHTTRNASKIFRGEKWRPEGLNTTFPLPTLRDTKREADLFIF